MTTVSKTEVLVPESIPFFTGGCHESSLIREAYSDRVYHELIRGGYIIVQENRVTYTQEIGATVSIFPEIVAEFGPDCTNILLHCSMENFLKLMNGYEQSLRNIFGAKCTEQLF